MSLFDGLNRRSGQGSGMERALGIGGIYFRASDPEALALWYENCLGVEMKPQGQAAVGLHPGGTSAPLAPDLAAQGADRGNGVMLNFRVRDLDQMVRQLRQKGIAIEVDPGDHPTGRLARFVDPEGNPLAIWELQGMDARE